MLVDITNWKCGLVVLMRERNEVNAPEFMGRLAVDNIPYNKSKQISIVRFTRSFGMRENETRELHGLALKEGVRYRDNSEGNTCPNTDCRFFIEFKDSSKN